jgi:DNA-binding Xre family transcriptional regulator
MTVHDCYGTYHINIVYIMTYFLYGIYWQRYVLWFIFKNMGNELEHNATMLTNYDAGIIRAAMASHTPKLTVKQAALRAGVGYTTMSAINRGMNVRVDSLVKVCRALGVTMTIPPESISKAKSETEAAHA